jgi:lipopolysaccharide export system protein LptA
MSPVNHENINNTSTGIHLYGMLAGTCIILLSFPVIQTHAQDRNTVVLRRADSFNVINENIREVIGNVEFQQGNIFVTCDKAIQFLTANRVELSGNVRITQDTVILTAPHGYYDGNTKIAFGDGGIMLNNQHTTIHADSGRYLTEEKKAFFNRNMMVVDSTSVLLAREGTYDQNTRKAECRGNVKVRSRTDNTLIYGDFLERFDDQSYTRIPAAPRLVRFDTTEGNIDTLIIISKLMESYADSTKRFIATDSVQLTHGQIAARSGKGIYYSGKDRIVLESSPIVWYEENQLTGDTITMITKQRKLDRVSVSGNAFAVSKSDSMTVTRFNQLRGRDLTMEFKDGKIGRIVVEKTATSLYYLYEENTPNGVNKSSGDTIILHFLKGQLQSITIVGGVQGNYYPEKMVRAKEDDYNLGGFRWITHRPSFRYIGETIIQQDYE